MVRNVYTSPLARHFFLAIILFFLLCISEFKMLQWASKILLLLVIAIFVVIVIGILVVGQRTKREWDVFTIRQAELKQQLSALQQERLHKEAYLRAFINDPEFVERVVRERLGYVEPGELIFRYETR